MSTAAAAESERYTYICPITHQVFRDPVVASDGFMYERSAMETWMRRAYVDVLSPMTNYPLANNALTSAAPEFLADLERFAAAHPEEERYEPPAATEEEERPRGYVADWEEWWIQMQDREAAIGRPVAIPAWGGEEWYQNGAAAAAAGLVHNPNGVQGWYQHGRLHRDGDMQFAQT